MIGCKIPTLDYARKVEDRLLITPAPRLYGSCFGAPTPGEAKPAEEPDGGMIPYLADFVGSSIAKILPSGPFGATADCTVEIGAPIRDGRFVARGNSVRPGREELDAVVAVLAVEGGEESSRATVPVTMRNIERAGAGR